eukprot:15366109-Ditylum_brightwellii.AAC.1
MANNKLQKIPTWMISADTDAALMVAITSYLKNKCNQPFSPCHGPQELKHVVLWKEQNEIGWDNFVMEMTCHNLALHQDC